MSSRPNSAGTRSRNSSSGSSKGQYNNNNRSRQSSGEQAPRTRPPPRRLDGAWGKNAGSLIAADDKKKAEEVREEYIRMGGVGIRPSMQETFKDKEGQELTQEYGKIGGNDIEDTEVAKVLPDTATEATLAIETVEMTASAADISDKSDVKVALPAEDVTESPTATATTSNNEQTINVTVAAASIVTTLSSTVDTENKCNAAESKAPISAVPTTTTAAPIITSDKTDQLKTEVAASISEADSWLPYPGSDTAKEKTTTVAPAKKPASDLADFLAYAKERSAEFKTSLKATFRRCDVRVQSIDEKLSKCREIQARQEQEQRETRIIMIDPKFYKEAKNHTETKHQLAHAEYNRKELAAENERLKASSLENTKKELRLKKENKELKETVDELTNSREELAELQAETAFLRWLHSVSRDPVSGRGSRSTSPASAVQLVSQVKVTKN